MADTARFLGRHVLVTGGSNGIGAAVVSRLLSEGAHVSSFDLAPPKSDPQPGFYHCEVDIRSASAIEHAHGLAVGRFGPVAALVNNAGRNVYADPVHMTEMEWDDVFGVDLKAAWLMARAVLPAMIGASAGAIVNVASIHSEMTYPGMFPYAAAKSGLVGLTRSLALEVAPHQIRVNALSPGYTDTALVKNFFEQNDPSLREKVLGVHPLGRLGKPDEIAACILFLLSDEASFVTGANWLVDGGLSARFAG